MLLKRCGGDNTIVNYCGVEQMPSDKRRMTRLLVPQRRNIFLRFRAEFSLQDIQDAE